MTNNKQGMLKIWVNIMATTNLNIRTDKEINIDYLKGLKGLALPDWYANSFWVLGMKVSIVQLEIKKIHEIEIKRYTEIGGLASMSLLSSSYACIEIIKYIAGLIQMEDSYKIRDEFLFHDMSLTYLNVKKNPEYPICGGGEKDES